MNNIASSARNPLQLLLEAAAFAVHKHSDQRRRDAAAPPYVNHCLAVARVLCVEGGVSDPLVSIALAKKHPT